MQISSVCVYAALHSGIGLRRLLVTALLVGSALPAAEPSIVLSIDAAGQLAIDGQKVPDQQVKELLRARARGPVVVEVHPERRFEEAAHLLDAGFGAAAEEVRLQLREAPVSMPVFFTEMPEVQPGATPGKNGILRLEVSVDHYPSDYLQPVAQELIDSRTIAIPRTGQTLLIRTPRDVTPPVTLQGREIEPYLRELLTGATDRTVFLSVDRSAPFGAVWKAVEMAHSAGASRIGFLTRSSE